MLEFMSRRSIFLALGLFAVSLTLHAQRLPGNAHPEHYRLALTPSIADAKFAGSEVIDLKLDTPSKTITLNAIELEIASVKAGSQTGAISFDKEKGQATFTFAQALPAGQNSLAIEFSGILNDKLRGFYLSKTKAGNYAVTQFESTDARRAFPSFDEPALKATFDVTLTVDAGAAIRARAAVKRTATAIGHGAAGRTGRTNPSLRGISSNLLSTHRPRGWRGPPRQTRVHHRPPRLPSPP